MTRRRLRLHALGPIRSDPGLLEWLRDELASELGADVELGPELPLHPAWRDPDDGRVRSDLVVDHLLRSATDRPGWTLALTDADLFVPGRRFVFGEAARGGPAAVVSLARLRGPELALFRLRALKEAIHEIGHLAGLDHCPDPDCVMAASTEIADTDRKLAALCSRCTTALDRSSATG